MSIRQKFIGDKKFYQKVLLIAVPIMVQNGITNFVSLLDNIMVGRLGTEQMSSVAVVNQLIFVYSLCIFGGMSGAGIFTAQYFGKKDDEGIRHTFRYKTWLGILLTTIAVIVFSLFGNRLIGFYLHGETESVAAALDYGTKYLWIMLLGLPAFMVVQNYASTLRECGATIVPMMAGSAAVLVNLTFNYLLIYGKYGFPELGVEGAAIATVMSRYVEVAIVVLWTHLHSKKHTFIVGVYSTMKIPMELVKKITIKGMPLLVNETMWAAGMAVLVQCYSVRGMQVVAALNISNTIYNLFNIAFIAMGDAVAIVVGQLLGAGKMKQAKDTDTKLIAFSVVCSIGIAAVMFLIAPALTTLFKPEPQAKEIAEQLIRATAIFMPQNAFLHAAYFTLRSGGKTIVTFLFDSVFVWCISIPVAFMLSHYTAFAVIIVFSLVQMADWIKCIVGFILVKRGVWLNDITHQ